MYNKNYKISGQVGLGVLAAGSLVGLALLGAIYFKTQSNFSVADKNGLLAQVYQSAWTTKAPMPLKRSSPAGGVSNGILYVAGGHDGTRDNSSLQAYDPSSNTWKVLASMPDGRYGGNGAGVIGNNIFVAGGWTTSPGVPNRNLFSYNIVDNVWHTTLTSMPTLSACGSTGVINGKLYVTTACDGFTGYRNFLHVWDPATNSWSALASSPNAHANPASGVINGKLYVAGGLNASGAVSATLDVYDPATNSWSTLAPMLVARSSAASAVVNGKLYVAGGGGKGGNLNTVEVYDPATNAWTSQPSMSTSRAGAVAGVINNVLYVAGGDSTNSTVEALDLSGSESYPGFNMSTDKSSYDLTEKLFLTLSRFDNKTTPYPVDLYILKSGSVFKAGSPDNVLVQSNLLVSLNTVKEIRLSDLPFLKEAGSGQYLLLLCKSGADCSNPANTNAISFQLVTTQPSIKVLSPNGGETYRVGDAMAIRWYAQNIPSGYVASIGLQSVQTGLFVDSPTQGYCNLTGGCISLTTGSMNYSIPASVSPGSYKIVINCWKANSETSDCSASDSSDAPFTISTSAPSIKVLSPNGGETFRAGDLMRIKWDASSVKSVRIYIDLVTKDYRCGDSSGTKCGSAVSNYLTPEAILASQGYYDWKIDLKQLPPFNLVNQVPDNYVYTIRVVDASNQSTIGDSSDAPFTIIAPTTAGPLIKVLSPSGDTISINSTQTIKWTSENYPANSLLHIRLIRFTNGVLDSYEKAIANNTVNDGSENWFVTSDIPTDLQYTYKISILCSGADPLSVSLGCGSVASLLPFTITAPGTLTLKVKIDPDADGPLGAVDVDVSGSAVKVAKGTNVRFLWESQNAETCGVGVNNTFEKSALNGSLVTLVSADTTFKVSCSKGGETFTKYGYANIETGQQTTIQALQSQINALLEQIRILQALIFGSQVQPAPAPQPSPEPVVTPETTPEELGFTGEELEEAEEFSHTWSEDLYYGLTDNEDVTALQYALIIEGCFRGSTTGNFFRLTRDGVICFQKKHNFTSIPGTGYVGSYTRSVLNKLYSNPDAQLFAQARDQKRIEDLAFIQNALAIYVSTVSSPDMDGGTNSCSSLCYVGASGVAANCGGRHGTKTTTIDTTRAVDGTGWIPVDFTSIPGGAPLAILPIDPINDATYFYSYACDNTAKTFELNANLESTRYATGGVDDKETNTKDGGNTEGVYEIGTESGLDL